MTEAEIVERLARREGWEKCKHGWSKKLPEREGWTGSKHRSPDMMRQTYFHDHAALQRVMRLLSGDEWDNLVIKISGEFSISDTTLSRFLLMLPTSDLARLVAESLTPCPSNP